LAMCGSETLKSYLPYLDVTTTCNADSNAAVTSKCGIGCALANAPNAQALCSLLENQAKCLEEQSAGCTDTARRYVLPRLNTYAMANKHLGCQIKYNGILVRTAGKDFDYITATDSCLLSDLNANYDNFGRLKSIFNRDTPVKAFCTSRNDEDVLLTKCRNNFLTCATPQHKLLSRIEDASIDKSAQFAPEIGAFPVDSFGMAYIYNWLPFACTSVLWSDRICVADVDKPVVTIPTSSLAPTTPSQDSNNGQPSSKKSENYEHSTAGPMLMPAALLILISLLSALIL